MAEQSRPFSQGYRGQSISPIPAGYLETYQNIARGMVAAGESIGKGVGTLVGEYQKNLEETEGQLALAQNNSGMWEQEVITMYGAGSKEHADFKAKIAKVPTMSLSQLKAWNASNAGRAELAKRAKDIEEFGANRARSDVLAARATIATEGIPDVPVKNTITVNKQTYRTRAEVDTAIKSIDDRLNDLRARAAEAGADVTDPRFYSEMQSLSENRKQLESARARVVDTQTVTAGRTQKIDALTEVAKGVAEMQDKEKGETTQAETEAVQEQTPKTYPVFGENKRDENIYSQQAYDQWNRAIAKTPYKNLVKRNHPSYNRISEGVVELVKSGEFSGKAFSELISKETEAANAVVPLLKEFEKRYSELIQQQPAVNDRGLKYAPSGSAEKLLKEIDPDGKIKQYFGETLVFTSSGVVYPNGASSSEYIPQLEKLGETYQAALTESSKQFKIRDNTVEVPAKKKAQATTKDTPRPDLTIPFRETAAKLNNGESVEINPFNEDGTLSPMMRVLNMADPTILNVTTPLSADMTGTVNYNVVAQSLAKMFDANVELVDGKFVIKPVEAPPVEVREIDVSQARNADEAMSLAKSNYIVNFLKQRGITPTPENVEYVANGGLSGNRKVEWSSNGVVSNAPVLSAEDRLKLEKLNADVESARYKNVQTRAEVASTVFNRSFELAPNGEVRANPEVFNPEVRDPKLRIYTRSTKVITPKLADEVRESLKSASNTFTLLNVSMPDRMRQVGLQLHQNPNHFVDKDGNIDGARLAGDERAMNDYIAELFKVVREQAQGLGPLAQNDYIFVFAQAGVPVTWAQILQDKGGMTEKLILGAVKTYAQSNPDFFNNARDGLIRDQKVKVMRLHSLTGGAVQVGFGGKAVDERGNIRPYTPDIERDIVTTLIEKSGSQTKSAVGKLIHMHQNPEKYVNTGNSRDYSFKSREEALDYAIKALSVELEWPEEYVMKALRANKAQTK